MMAWLSIAWPYLLAGVVIFAGAAAHVIAALRGRDDDITSEHFDEPPR